MNAALGSDVEVQASAGGFMEAMRSEPEPSDFNFEVTESTTLSELQGALDRMYETNHETEEPQEILESASSSEDSSDDSSSESYQEVFHSTQTDRDTYPEIIAFPGDLVQNKKSRMLHRVSHGSDVSLCGLHGPNFNRMREGSKFWWPRCNKCFKGELCL